jgi:cobalt-zinc-cadmium efflux system membrane fusion protein
VSQKREKAYFGGISSIFLLLAVAACSKAEPQGGHEIPEPAPGFRIFNNTISFPAESPQLSTLRVVKAEPERLSQVRINGRISWDETRTARINPPLAGRVVALKAEPGEQLQQGEVLAVISSPEFGQAQAESRRAQTDLKQTEQALLRNRVLHEAGVIALKELQYAEADFSRARAELERTKARDRLYGSSGRIDQQFELRAPIDGVIVNRNVNVGQEFRPDQTGGQPMFVISDPTRLWISLDVPEALTQIIAVGENLRISVPALPGEIFSAQVQYVADFVDPVTRTIRARASLDNRARRLKSEMYVSADVEVPPSSALRVPATSLFLLEDQYFAFTEKQVGVFERIQVRAEEAPLGFMRVIEGLHPGQRIVADGALLLQQLLNQNLTAPDKSATNTDQK